MFECRTFISVKEICQVLSVSESKSYAIVRDLNKELSDKGYITKSYQRISGRDVITKPKTPKSVRMISMPENVALEMKDFLDSIYGIEPSDRIFVISKSYLHHEMDRGVKASGVKRIRLHDLRHSHVSLLIDMGFSAVAIGNRVGHESSDITYRYAHMMPSIQDDMAEALDEEWKEGFDVSEES